MKSVKKRLLIGSLALSVLLAGGAAMALPANGWEITYYDAQGNIVGESSYYCGSRFYKWGQVTTIYDQITFPCR
jgi:Family of unknown function (DUF6289)